MNLKPLFLLVALLIASPTPSAAVEISSVYTDLSPKTCTVVPASGEPGDDDGLRCQGPSGWELLVLSGDNRASVSLVSPNGVRHDLNYWDVITGGFSSLGLKAEWRVTKKGAGVVPVALIVRVIAQEDPDQPTKKTGYLAVAKVSESGACVTDRIKATGTENARARVAADASAGKACLETLK